MNFTFWLWPLTPRRAQAESVYLKHLLHRLPEGQRIACRCLKDRIVPPLRLQKLCPGLLERGHHIVNVNHIIVLFAAGQRQFLPGPHRPFDQIQNLRSPVAGAVGVGKDHRHGPQQPRIGVVGQQIGKGLLCGGVKIQGAE